MEDNATRHRTADAENQQPAQHSLVIIGAGPGGYSCALRAAELGMRVTLVERDPVPGGTCLNRGCIPSKALLTAAHAFHDATHSARMGVHADATVDWDQLAAFRDSAIDSMVSGLSSLLDKRGVTVVHGEASLVQATDGADTAGNAQGSQRQAEPTHCEVRVRTHATIANVADSACRARGVAGSQDTMDGGLITLRADDVVIATGAHPTALEAVPFSDRVMDSDSALAAPRAPRSAVIVGSGAIGLEFASFWNTMGTHVTMLVRHGRPLSGWHRRVGSTVMRGLAARGVEFVTYRDVEACEESEDSVRLTLAGSRVPSVEAEACLVAIGRTPDTTLAADAGIALTDRGFIATDGFGRTSRPHVWAVGDVTQGRQLAHRAFEQGIVAAEAMAGLRPAPVVDTDVPQVVFSEPQAASVGLTADQATAQGYADVSDTAYVMGANARTLMSGEPGVIDVVTGVPAQVPADRAHDARDAAGRVVLGVHMAGPSVSELVSEAEQLVRQAVPLSQAARAIHPHPTFGEALGEALLKADGRPLHTF